MIALLAHTGYGRGGTRVALFQVPCDGMTFPAGDRYTLLP